VSSWLAMAAGPHAIEVGWTSAALGAASLSVDGVLRQTLSAIDTSAARAESVRLGAIAGLGAGVSGPFAFDRFVSTRGSTIGR